MALRLWLGHRHNSHLLAHVHGEDMSQNKPIVVFGDETHAEALRIAERHLLKQGWKFTPVDVANTAREIIETLSKEGPTNGR